MSQYTPPQSPMASVAAGGGIVAGISAALIAAYAIMDCHAYKTRQGQCSEIVQIGIPAIVAGLASVSSFFGGYWSYNHTLRRPSVRDERED